MNAYVNNGFCPGGGSNIPTGFDISPSNFGKFFHPGANFPYELPHAWEIPKTSNQNNLKKSNNYYYYYYSLKIFSHF